VAQALVPERALVEYAARVSHDNAIQAQPVFQVAATPNRRWPQAPMAAPGC